MNKQSDKPLPLCGDGHLDVEHEARVRSGIPTEDAAVDAASLFAHLSDSTRVRILSMLAISDMCVCEMADILAMSQPAVSHHLRILRQCGVVRFRKQGQRAVYFLNDNETGRLIRRLLAAVREREADGDGEA